MSIAVSALIKPSRCYAILVIGFAAFFWLTGMLIFAGRMGGFILYARIWLMPVFLLAGLLLVFDYFRTRKTLRIDISGNGQIRLKEYKGNEFDVSESENGSSNGSPWKLMGNSTIWPWLMVLNLESETGHISRILIFFDSMPTDDFKVLYAAFRWIDAHKKI